MQATKTYKMETGITVYSKVNGEGKVIGVDGSKVTVDFNGSVKVMMEFLLSDKPAKSKKRSYMTAKPISKSTAKELFHSIKGDRGTRSSFWDSQFRFGAIAQKADETGHFAGDVIKAAWDGKFVSDKQAWVVAFFAEKNNLLNID